MDFTDTIKGALSTQVDLTSLYTAAKADGMVSLREVAIRKMLEGVTTYEEVVAVTGKGYCEAEKGSARRNGIGRTYLYSRV